MIIDAKSVSRSFTSTSTFPGILLLTFPHVAFSLISLSLISSLTFAPVVMICPSILTFCTHCITEYGGGNFCLIVLVVFLYRELI